ncbi:PleD family two-component system response regulator [Myxosarcina sp. GI1]|uniref:response regulator n=1 Tax=Myxosarcina sp. GI1 TaxID=1541065 RepID=UPI000559C696|nr:response regulator [Myxosarcina sp. GI1]
MQSKQYKSQELSSVLEILSSQNFSGTFHIETQGNFVNTCNTCVLIWRNGELVFGGLTIPSNLKFAEMLVKKFKPDFINVAIQTAKERVDDSTSFREILELFVKIKILTWEQVENCVFKKIVQHLDRLWQFPGVAKWQTTTEFDLSYGEDRHGLKWKTLQQELNKRQQKWKAIEDLVPSMNAIPYKVENLDRINNSTVKEHLQKYVNGRRSLLAIAEKIDRDPLAVAQTYYKWVKLNWIDFEQNTTRDGSTSGSSDRTQQTPENSDLPMILSVDDSPIVQKSIERALKEVYRVVLAGNAKDALAILNREPIRLVLLDLTMPDVDGLQFCKTIKKIPKFHDLPIVMVTARDGLLDKMKGHLAGTDKYITKPFEPEQLRQVVNKYVNANVL